jgi:hypothetical protein
LLGLFKKVAETTRLLEDDDPASIVSAEAAADPRSAVVWIEAIVSGVGNGEDEPQRVASYRNGAVVSEDGLIAVAFDKPLRDVLANAGENNPRDKMAVSVFFGSDVRYDAKIVAFHPSSGLALLKIEASGLNSFDCGPAVGMNQMVRYVSTSGLDGPPPAVGPTRPTHMYETQVMGIPGFPMDVSPGTFQINGAQVAGQSGIAVAHDGTLVGLATRVEHNRVDPAVANDAIRVVCLDAGLVKQLLDQIAVPPSPEPSKRNPP